MIAAKNEWCPMCRTEHTEDAHTDKIHEWKAIEMLDESKRFVPQLQIDMAYDLTILRIDECIKVHHYLDGDGCGIGNSYKFWNEVKKSLNKLKKDKLI